VILDELFTYSKIGPFWVFILYRIKSLKELRKLVIRPSSPPTWLARSKQNVRKSPRYFRPMSWIARVKIGVLESLS